MVSIRTADEKDVAALVELSYGLFQEDAGQRDGTVNLEWPVEYGEAYFRDFMAREGRRCWLAEVNGEVVGYLYDVSVF